MYVQIKVKEQDSIYWGETNYCPHIIRNVLLESLKSRSQKLSNVTDSILNTGTIL